LWLDEVNDVKRETISGQGVESAPELTIQTKSAVARISTEFEDSSHQYHEQQPEKLSMTAKALHPFKRGEWNLNRKYEDKLFYCLVEAGAETAGVSANELIEKMGYCMLNNLRCDLS
jgi:predicted HicB family RNase H-like nuclease